jgi:signal peptidase I
VSEAFTVTKFRCTTCKHVYDSKEGADRCESKPITQDRGVKVGDVVRITAGDGTGKTATVESVYVVDREWGHYAWERYWHTIALTAKVNDNYGHRVLVFDSYERAT